eukprot:1993757-Pleurochrysis_carterae.AAC.1
MRGEKGELENQAKLMTAIVPLLVIATRRYLRSVPSGFLITRQNAILSCLHVAIAFAIEPCPTTVCIIIITSGFCAQCASAIAMAEEFAQTEGGWTTVWHDANDGDGDDGDGDDGDDDDDDDDGGDDVGSSAAPAAAPAAAASPPPPPAAAAAAAAALVLMIRTARGARCFRVIKGGHTGEFRSNLGSGG